MLVYNGRKNLPLSSVLEKSEVSALISDLGLELQRSSFAQLSMQVPDLTLEDLCRQVNNLVKELCSYCSPALSCEDYNKRNHTHVHKSNNNNAQLSFDWD